MVFIMVINYGVACRNSVSRLGTSRWARAADGDGGMVILDLSWEQSLSDIW